MVLPLLRVVGSSSVETSKGWIGFAWSLQGLVAVTLPQPDRAAAGKMLPPVAVESQDVAVIDVATFKDRLRRYFDGEPVSFDEPLEPTIGTRFQQKVWAITRAIPRGETRTYGEIARAVGSPSAARAVGQSMARNPWPVVVPCHRVIGRSGQLTGFGGGLDLKRWMLETEGAQGAL